MSGSNDDARGLAHRLASITVKVALVAFAGFYVHDMVRPIVYDWVRPLIVSPLASYDAETRYVSAQLLTGPDTLQDANFRQQLAVVEEHYAQRSYFLFVADRNMRIVYRTPVLEQVDGDFTSAQTFRVHAGGQLVGTAITSFSPINTDGGLGGWRGFVRFMSDRLDLAPADGPILRIGVDSPIIDSMQYAEEVDAQRSAGYARARGWSWAAVTIVLSAAFALILSLFITRRLRRLARDAARSDEDDLSKPFAETGRDEIASLARVLDERRLRILELIRGLRESDRQRREWLAQVSHDLRTPLTSIEICLQRLRRDLTGEQRKNADLAAHDCHRLRTLSDNLLEIGRLGMGQDLIMEPVLPQEVVTAAARSNQPLAEERGVALEVGGSAPGLEEIVADGGRLVRACENLLRNAIRHAAKRVKILVETSEGTVRFVVLDDGPGFEGGVGPVALDQFEMPGSHPDSAGLGLIVSRSVAEAHDGCVLAANGADGWTRVWLEIPKNRAAA